MVFNFFGAVAQASEATSNRAVAKTLVFVGFGVEVFMSTRRLDRHCRPFGHVCVGRSLPNSRSVVKFRKQPDFRLRGKVGKEGTFLICAFSSCRHLRSERRNEFPIPDRAAAADRIAARHRCRGIRPKPWQTPRGFPASVPPPRAYRCSGARSVQRVAECDVLIALEREGASTQASQPNGSAFATAVSDRFAAARRERSAAHLAGLTWGEP